MLLPKTYFYFISSLSNSWLEKWWKKYAWHWGLQKSDYHQGSCPSGASSRSWHLIWWWKPSPWCSIRCQQVCCRLGPPLRNLSSSRSPFKVTVTALSLQGPILLPEMLGLQVPETKRLRGVVMQLCLPLSVSVKCNGGEKCLQLNLPRPGNIIKGHSLGTAR